jgi:hypothetical protein
MSTSSFAKQAKSLARNPIGIIALFIVLVYAMAACVLGFSSALTPDERLPIVWFLVSFPVLVLLSFVWLVAKHHEKLYAPTDYESDEGFLSSARLRIQRIEAAQDQQSALKINVINTLVESQKMDGRVLEELIEKISDDIDSSTVITVDATSFLGESNAIFKYPVATFINLSDLLNEVYFKILSKVEPFRYGEQWVLRDMKSHMVIKNSRMIHGSMWERTEPDTRPLREVGIDPGAILKVERLTASK